MKKIVYLFIVASAVVACSGPSSDTNQKSQDAPSNLKQLVFEREEILVPTISDTTLVYKTKGFTSEVRIKMPESKYRGTILVLQGWNFSNTSWSDSSDLDALASEMGFALVMPDMGKSIYHKRVYPETRKDWRKYPTRTWLVDTVLADLRSNYELLVEGQPNFVMGLSTGGRGAFILAQENPKTFRAGASLSGDYDQEAFPDDNLYKGYFGTDSEKWSDDENPVREGLQIQTSMYVTHGGADNVVPVAHHERLIQVIKERVGPEILMHGVDTTAGHDYAFWASEVSSILEFFANNF